jgi:tripartite-type tricarboxylate transporter receptor subunit TctC
MRDDLRCTGGSRGIGSRHVKAGFFGRVAENKAREHAMARMTRRSRNFAVGLVGALVFSAPPLFAESWPQRAVRLIVPTAAGGIPDVPARLFAERLADRWNQPVVVENRPGADTLIGVTAFAGMRDGHALLVSPAAPISVLPVIHDKLPYDPTRDLVPISSIGETFPAVSASESLKIGSLAELVMRARSQPGKVSYNAGTGAFPILFAGFTKSAGIDMLSVSYRDTNVAYQDLAAGRIQIMLTTITGVLPVVQAGKARLLAVTNKQRAPIAPEVPTAAEAGYPDLTFDGLSGFFGPGDMPMELRDRVAADIRAVAAEPAIVNRLAAIGMIVRGSTPAAFAAAIEEQRAKMASIAKSLGAVPAR